MTSSFCHRNLSLKRNITFWRGIFSASKWDRNNSFIVFKSLNEDLLKSVIKNLYFVSILPLILFFQLLIVFFSVKIRLTCTLMTKMSAIVSSSQQLTSVPYYRVTWNRWYVWLWLFWKQCCNYTFTKIKITPITLH